MKKSNKTIISHQRITWLVMDLVKKQKVDNFWNTIMLGKLKTERYKKKIQYSEKKSENLMKAAQNFSKKKTHFKETTFQQL